MARYYYHLTNYHHKSRHYKRLRRFIIFFLILLAVAGTVLGLSVFRDSNQKVDPVSQETTIIQQSSVTVLRSEYFQFQATSGWSQVQGSTVPGQYLYRNLSNNLINQEISVFVNTLPEDMTAEYVLPVSVDAKGLLHAEQTSEHCKNYSAKGISATSLESKYQDISFKCHVDGTDYTILVGLKGQSTTMRLPRPNGTTAQYVIRYRDLTANPGPGQVSNMISSFQTR